MKKTIITFLLCVLFAIALTGCGEDTPVVKHSEKRFMVVERYEDADIVVDTETGVLYYKQPYRMTVLLDSYGNPLIYPGFDAREDRP